MKIIVLSLIFIIVFQIYFNRQPKPFENHIINPKYVIKPCDGTLVSIKTQSINNINYYTIQWYLGLQNIHSQFLPVEGRIIKIQEHKQKSKPYLATDSTKVLNNYQIHTYIQPQDTPPIIVEQISGFLTPSITTNPKFIQLTTTRQYSKDLFPRGTYLGHIYFGSTVRLHLPTTHYRLNNSNLKLNQNIPIFSIIASKV